MDQISYANLHRSCLDALSHCIAEAEQTHRLLNRITFPIATGQREKVLAQKGAEDDARSRYLTVRQLLMDAIEMQLTPSER